MILMGLDVASTTGIARWDLSRPESAILCSTIKSPTKIKGKPVFDQQVAYRLTNEFRADIRAHGKPDFVIMEAPIKIVPKEGGNVSAAGSANTTALMNCLAGAMTAVVAGLQCPMEVVSVNGWRKPVYGFASQKGWQKKDWKRHARQSCEQMGIVFKGDDEAEAALIAFYGGRISQAVKMMRLKDGSTT